MAADGTSSRRKAEKCHGNALEHIHFCGKMNVLQFLAFGALSNGKPVPTFPENALSEPIAALLTLAPRLAK
jgi:hypothetical protein